MKDLLMMLQSRIIEILSGNIPGYSLTVGAALTTILDVLPKFLNISASIIALISIYLVMKTNKIKYENSLRESKQEIQPKKTP